MYALLINMYLMKSVNFGIFITKLINLELIINFTRFYIFSEKKVIDIDKPMRLGAFVDVSRAKQYTEDDYSLPETPPFSWLLRNKRDETGSGSTDNDDNLASSPSDENSASLLNTMTPAASAALSQQQQPSTAATNNNNANMKSLEASKATTVASASPKGSSEQLVGTSPSSLGGGDFKRSSSRWSTRTLPGEDEKLLKELYFPFATQNTPISDLAKFYRECFNAPPLQQFSEIDPTSEEVVNPGSCGSGGGGVAVRNESIDDLTQQLEKFETSLNDYDTLVTSLCQQSNEVDSNSNS